MFQDLEKHYYINDHKKLSSFITSKNNPKKVDEMIIYKSSNINHHFNDYEVKVLKKIMPKIISYLEYLGVHYEIKTTGLYYLSKRNGTIRLDLDYIIQDMIDYNDDKKYIAIILSNIGGHIHEDKDKNKA